MLSLQDLLFFLVELSFEFDDLLVQSCLSQLEVVDLLLLGLDLFLEFLLLSDQLVNRIVLTE